MKALQMPKLTEEQRTKLAKVYRTTKDVRIRTRAQMVLLACEQHLSAPSIAAIVREDDETVRRWLKRYLVEGIDGLADRPRAGAPAKTTEAYDEQLLATVRRRPRSRWRNPTPCGRFSASPSIWLSKRASSFRRKRCVVF